LQIADKEKLEEFLIDSIHDGVINGKIDELNGQLLVTFHQQVGLRLRWMVFIYKKKFQREFGKAQWEDLQTRMGVLLKNLDLFRTNLQMMILGEEGGGELP
jgi:hypothetical protein